MISIWIAVVALAGVMWFYRSPKPLFETDDLDALEDQLDRADDIFPFLARQPLIWVALLGMAANIGMNWNFSQVLAYEIWLGIIVWGLLSVFDLAVPFITLAADTNRDGDDTESATGPVANLYMFVVVSSVLASIVVGITSFGAIGTRSNEVNKNHIQKIQDWRAELPRVNSLIQELNNEIGNGTYEGFKRTALEYRQKASREGGRNGCGTKCEGWKDKQIAFQVKATKAKRRAELVTRREFLRSQLDAQTAVQTSANGAVTLLEAVFGDVDDDKAMLYFVAFIVTSFMAVTPVIWKYGIDGAQASRCKNYKRVKRSIRRQALKLDGGPAWLAQRFTEGELHELNPAVTDLQTDMQVSALSAKLDEMKAVEAPNVTNINVVAPAQNQEAINRILTVLDAIPHGKPTPIGGVYDLYVEAGGQVPRSQFNQLLPHALASRANVSVDENWNLTVEV